MTRHSHEIGSIIIGRVNLEEYEIIREAAVAVPVGTRLLPSLAAAKCRAE